MLVKAAVDAFFAVCSGTIAASKAVSSFVRFLLSLNYRIVSSVYSALLWTYETVSICIVTVASILAHVGITLWDFFIEITACVGSFLIFLWQFLHLIYRTVCLLFTALESAILCVWSGGKLTISTVTKSAVEVADACELTWNEGVAMVTAVGVGMQEALTWVGRASVATVTGAWLGLGYIFASLLQCLAFLSSRLLRAAARLVDGLSLAATGLSNETYLGVIVCCIIYLLLSRVCRYFQSTPLTLVQRQHQHHHRPAGFHRDDFESDVEYSDPELLESDDDEEEGEDTSDEDEDDSGSDVDVLDDDIDFSDDDDEDDVGTQIGEQNDVYGLSDSEDEQVDVRLLPKQDSPYSLRSRSSTPAHVTPNFTHEDFEREIERERDRRKCVVCQDLAKSVLIMPCRHMCLCVTCAHRMTQERAARRICPLCRQRIQSVIGVYV